MRWHETHDKAGNYHCGRTFDTWSDWVEHVKACQPLHGSQSNSSASGWYGHVTFDQALELARTGYQGPVDDLIRRLGAIRTSLRDAVKARWQSRLGVRGTSVHAGRLATGNPKCVKRRVRVQQVVRTRPVRVLVNSTASCGVDSEVIARRGAILAALVDAIHRAGKPVEVWSAFCISGDLRGSSSTTYLIPVLSAGQPLNLPILSFAIGHAAAFRRLCFRAWENESADFAYRFNIGSNYGYPCRVLDSVKAEYGDVTFDRMTAGGLGEHSDKWRTPEGAAAWIIETLEGLGIEVEKVTR